MQKTIFHTITALFLFFTCCLHNASAAPVFNAPVIRIQPNGDTLRCLVSGDEYYHRLHDKRGFTIVQNHETGYWVYADTIHTTQSLRDSSPNLGEQPVTGKGERWEVVATNYVVGSVDPATVGISPNLGVDRTTWERMQHRLDVPTKTENGGQRVGNGAKTSGRNHGTLNNIVIFIRFSDETEISTPFSTIDAMFNDSSANANSMLNYFRHASYNKINIPTFFFPNPNGNNIISYQDSLPRSYYMPYDAQTNTNGYQDDDESRNREFNLLERAVNYVNANYPVPTSLNIDNNNDGEIDNICFVVKGTYTGWSDLLWPHKWSLYDRHVYINGKRVYTFNLQLEGSGSHYFSSSTFCHEMFHSLGAPDLYRYNVGTDVSGVGSWDLMCSNTTPPQHMSAHMKWKYGNWLDTIPEITVQGTYTLHSLADSDYSNCAYKIAAQEPHQWYVFEYRDNSELFETALPGKGLIIFRIDDRFNGNAGYDGVNNFDEVYLFRPNASNDSTNGNPSQAFFRSGSGRTSFTPTTNPHPWLTGNVIDSTIAITSIGSAGQTISFTYTDLRGCRIPDRMSASSVTGTTASLSWTGNAPSYTIEWRIAGETESNVTVANGLSLALSGLALNTRYEWRLRGLCSENDSTDFTPWSTFRTSACPMPESITIANGDTTSYHIPINTYYNYTYTQMLYTPSEVGQAMDISKISFNYASSNRISCKNNCIIYMGYKADSNFAGNAVSNLVPFNQLTKVYEGPFNFSTGWNTLQLDTIFSYNGTQCLVVAIDDNSGQYHSSSYRFNCTRTGSRYSTLTFYSDNDNYNPASSSSSTSCIKSRIQLHPDIIFEGCPYGAIQYYSVTINNSNPESGSVTGDGYYEAGETATLTALPNEHCHFDGWLYPNGTIITDNPYTIVVDSNIIVTALIIPDSHNITVTKAGSGDGYISSGGRFPYGHSYYVYADANAHNRFVHWICNNTGETFDDARIDFTVTADSSFTAIFEKERHEVEVINANPAWGNAWFSTVGGNEVLTIDSVDYGAVVELHAEPLPDSEEFTFTFVSWADGTDANPRQVVVKSDTSFTAIFSCTQRPVSIAEANPDGVNITVDDGQIIISGAKEKTVSVYDLTGRKLFSTEVLSSQFTIRHSLFTGVYIVQIDGIKPKKVVIR